MDSLSNEESIHQMLMVKQFLHLVYPKFAHYLCDHKQLEIIRIEAVDKGFHLALFPLLSCHLEIIIICINLPQDIVGLGGIFRRICRFADL